MSKSFLIIYNVLLAGLCLFSACNSETTNQTTTNSDSTYVFGKDYSPLTSRLAKLVDNKVRMEDRQLSIYVWDLTKQKEVYAFRPKALIAPASCLKVLTAVSAIKSLGMNYEYSSQLLLKGEQNRNGTFYGSVILRLEDDPLFESFNEFATELKNRNIKRIEGDIFFDLLRTDTLKAHSTAANWDIKYHKLPLLFKGEKRIEKEFMYQLAAKNIKFHKNPTFSLPTLPDEADSPISRNIAIESACSGAKKICETRHRLTDVISPMLINSSNIKAEAVYGHLFLKDKRVFGLQVIENPLVSFMHKEMSIANPGFVINDGSGLSPDNLLNTHFLVQTLKYTYNNKEIFDYFVNEALASPGAAGRTGSLTTRMSNTKCVGNIFCKTGTLVTKGGSGLTGFAKGSNGHWYAFAILNIDMPVFDARQFQDRFCKELVK